VLDLVPAVERLLHGRIHDLGTHDETGTHEVLPFGGMVAVPDA
jgi:hypothetical protein